LLAETLLLGRRDEEDSHGQRDAADKVNKLLPGLIWEADLLLGMPSDAIASQDLLDDRTRLYRRLGSMIRISSR
jgi:hypothetical protein